MLQNLRNKLKDNKGFSLVELIVVIAIMVILIALLVPQVSGYIAKARSASNESNAKAIYNAAVQYLADQAQAGIDVMDITDIKASDSFKDSAGTSHVFSEEYLPKLEANADYTITCEKGRVKQVDYIISDDVVAGYPEATT